LAFFPEKFSRCADAQTIDVLANQRTKVASIKREKNIRRCERCNEHGLVFCDLEQKRPFKYELVGFYG
jgi:hypothetical protein